MRCCFFFTFLVCLPLVSEAQKEKKRGFLFFKINRFDKDGNYHGRWKSVFRKGGGAYPKWQIPPWEGSWRLDVLLPNGNLYMKEKHSRKTDLIKVEKYEENGAISRKGEARMMRTYTMDRYYWTGEWEIFDQEGNFSHIEVCSNGNLVGKR